jgi:hypothetical protein
MGRIAVEDIRKGHLDESDQKILTVYYRSGSRYAIYRTPERVALQYSDSQNEQKEQRKRLATLGPIRGEINGLIDGWRNLADKTFEQPDDVPLTGKTGRNASKVNRYDRRVADALLIALEGEDGPGALALLEQIKTDLIEERKSWARVLYVLYAAAAVGTIAVLSAAISWLFLAKSCMPNGLWLGLASGCVGGVLLDRAGDPQPQRADRSADERQHRRCHIAHTGRLDFRRSADRSASVPTDRRPDQRYQFRARRSERRMHIRHLEYQDHARRLRRWVPRAAGARSAAEGVGRRSEGCADDNPAAGAAKARRRFPLRSRRRRPGRMMRPTPPRSRRLRPRYRRRTMPSRFRKPRKIASPMRR